VESDVSIRRALILILGEYPPDSVPDRQGLLQQLLKFYREDPDAGIHGAAGWVLRQWGHSEAMAGIDNELATGQVEGDRQWYVTRTQQRTFSVLPGPVTFLMGSPRTEQDRFSRESRHRRRISQSFAISRTEVTVGQFQEFLRQSPGVRHIYLRKYAPDPSCPQISVTWYEAAAYCRWLSEQEGIAEDQMCYPPVSEIKPGLVLPSNYLSRTGYRLPSESEWEYACRGGAVTSRCYGRSAALLSEYGWFQSSSSDRTWPVGGLKPNGVGLFDMHGNVYEWCQERYASYSPGSTISDTEDTTALSDTVRRVLRGGSFFNLSSDVRSALRNYYQPVIRNYTFGFRPARTYHLSP
jgi:formylglycine-generating enzyme required for sulfatase activity